MTPEIDHDNHFALAILHCTTSHTVVLPPHRRPAGEPLQRPGQPHDGATACHVAGSVGGLHSFTLHSPVVDRHGLWLWPKLRKAAEPHRHTMD